MIRVKLPLGGVTPDQMDAFANVVERTRRSTRATSRRARTSRSTTSRCPDEAELIREISAAGLSSREGCGNTVRNVTGDPWAGVAADELFDPTDYAIAYVRYFVRHPTTQLMPRKIKTAFSSSDADRAITGIHDIGFIPRVRDGVKGFEIRVGGGTSIMPRIAPTLYEFVAADDGEYLKVTEAALRIFDRQDWLRVNRARARIKVLVDKIGIDEFRRMVDRELEGDWVAERDFSIERLLPEIDEEASAPAPPSSPGSPNGDRSEFEAFVADNVAAAAPGRVLDRARQGHPRRPQPGAVPRPRSDHARLLRRQRPDDDRPELRPPLGPRRVGLRRLLGAPRARPRRQRRRHDHRRDLLPGHRLVQARDHRLDGPEPGAAGAGRVDEHHRPADPADPPEDERLPERLRPAPHRHDRLLRSLDQGRRAHDARLHPAHRRRPPRTARSSTAARLKVRLPAKRVPDAVERWLRMYEAERNEGEDLQRLRRRASGPPASRRRSRSSRSPAEFNLDNMLQFIDWSRRDPYKVERGEGECAI